MKPPPMTYSCICGHIGARHRDDHTCAARDCDCERFIHRAVPHRLLADQATSRNRRWRGPRAQK